MANRSGICAPSFVRAILVLSALLAICPASPAAIPGEVTPDYKLSADDVVLVTVLSHPEFSGEFLIPQEGRVEFPGVGDVRVTGLTLPDLGKAIKSGLLKTLREPEVFVTLRAARPNIVHIMGSVNKQGPYSLKPDSRVSEAISIAGGLPSSVDSADCTVTILRALGGERQRVSLSGALRGNADDNAVLKPGDIVTVEPLDVVPIYITGSVRSPGIYRVPKDAAGVMTALTMAGGGTDNADLTRVSITHVDGGKKTISLLSATKDPTVPDPMMLQRGDLINVPGSDDRVSVMGWVTSPGLYALKQGQQTTLSDVLGMAKGPSSKRTALNNVSILRIINGKQERLVFNFENFVKNGDVSQNPPVHAGDIIWVPETSKLDWDRAFSGISSVTSLVLMWRAFR